MLYGPYSLASVLMRPLTPARTELERIKPSTGCLTVMDVMAMKRPQRRRCMTGSASFAKYTVLIKLSSAARCQSSGVVSANDFAGGPPALATQMSTCPYRSEEHTSELQSRQ